VCHRPADFTVRAVDGLAPSLGQTHPTFTLRACHPSCGMDYLPTASEIAQSERGRPHARQFEAARIPAVKASG